MLYVYWDTSLPASATVGDEDEGMKCAASFESLLMAPDIFSDIRSFALQATTSEYKDAQLMNKSRNRSQRSTTTLYTKVKRLAMAQSPGAEERCGVRKRGESVGVFSEIEMTKLSI